MPEIFCHGASYLVGMRPRKLAPDVRGSDLLVFLSLAAIRRKRMNGAFSSSVALRIGRGRWEFSNP